MFWWREWDSNPRPLGYEPSELPDCSIPLYGGSGRNRTCEPARADLLLSGQFRTPTADRFRRRMAQESNLWDPSLGPAAFRAVPHASCGCHPWRDLLESHQRRRFCGPPPELLGQSLMADAVGLEPTHDLRRVRLSRALRYHSGTHPWDRGRWLGALVTCVSGGRLATPLAEEDAGWNAGLRSQDPRFNGPALYQLSYVPMVHIQRVELCERSRAAVLQTAPSP